MYANIAVLLFVAFECVFPSLFVVVPGSVPAVFFTQCLVRNYVAAEGAPGCFFFVLLVLYVFFRHAYSVQRSS